MTDKEITLEKAKQVLHDYPEEDHYVQAHFQNGLHGGEYWDNTVETANYWNRCKKICTTQKSELPSPH